MIRGQPAYLWYFCYPDDVSFFVKIMDENQKSLNDIKLISQL